MGIGKIVTLIILLPLAYGGAKAPTKSPWSFAGEQGGITFHFRVQGGCKDPGSKVRLKLINGVSQSRKVEFRLNDTDWHRNLEIVLGPSAGDSSLVVAPGQPICAPYIDQVYSEPLSDSPQPLSDSSEPAGSAEASATDKVGLSGASASR